MPSTTPPEFFIEDQIHCQHSADSVSDLKWWDQELADILAKTQDRRDYVSLSSFRFRGRQARGLIVFGKRVHFLARDTRSTGMDATLLRTVRVRRP